MRRLLYVVDGAVIIGTRITGNQAILLDRDTVELTLQRAGDGMVVYLKDATVNGQEALVVGFPWDRVSAQGLPTGPVYGD